MSSIPREKFDQMSPRDVALITAKAREATAHHVNFDRALGSLLKALEAVKAKNVQASALFEAADCMRRCAKVAETAGHARRDLDKAMRDAGLVPNDNAPPSVNGEKR